MPQYDERQIKRSEMDADDWAASIRTIKRDLKAKHKAASHPSKQARILDQLEAVTLIEREAIANTRKRLRGQA